MATKRKHRATGKKPPGGPREGAGRPEGSKSALGYGEVQAVKALRWQVPTEAPEDLAVLADRAFQRVSDVMEGKVHSSNAASVLGAATRVREWVCGPVQQKVKVSGDAEAPLTIEIRKYTTEGVPCQATTTEELPQRPQQPPEEETPPREE